MPGHPTLLWSKSSHVGTPNKIAGFDADGNATYLELTEGVDGSKWYTAAGVPNQDTGTVDDFYLNSSNGDYYKKTDSTTWTLQGNLKGATGAQGPQGIQGVAGTNGSNGANGNDGLDGSKWYTGVGNPEDGNGVIGDFYLRSSNGDYFEKTGPTTWTLQGNLKGLQGDTGATGATGAQGSAGSNGTNGTNGSDGTDGSKWYTGSGVPDTGTGVVGDFYLRSSNGDYYEKTGPSTWTLQGNLKGIQGDTGSQGIQGPTGPQGDTGPAGTTVHSELSSLAITTSGHTASATDVVVGRSTSGGGALEEIPFKDSIQQASALNLPGTTQGSRMGWTWEEDSTGVINWMSRMVATTIRCAIYPISTSLEAWGVSATGFGTAAFPGGDSRGRGQTRTSGANAGNEAGWRYGNGNEIEPHWSFFLRQRIKVGSVTNCRYWFGWAGALSNFPNGDTLTGAQGAVALRFSSVVPDTNWQLCLWNGTSQTVIDTGIPVTADNEYVLDIWTRDNGVTYFYGVTNITAGTYATGSSSSTVPSVTTAGIVAGKIINVAGGAGSARVFTFYSHDATIGNWTW